MFTTFLRSSRGEGKKGYSKNSEKVKKSFREHFANYSTAAPQ